MEQPPAFVTLRLTFGNAPIYCTVFYPSFKFVVVCGRHQASEKLIIIIRIALYSKHMTLCVNSMLSVVTFDTLPWCTLALHKLN